MKKKFRVLLLILTLFMISEISAFAGDWSEGGGGNDTSQAFMKVWDDKYHYKVNIKGQDLYLYDVKMPNAADGILKYNLGAFFGGERPFIYGQFAYLPINNNGDPANLAPLKNPANFVKTFEIPGNSINDVGSSYQGTTGRVYPSKYPAGHAKAGTTNYNFKTSTADFKTKVWDATPNPDKQFFTNGTLSGNIRFAYSKEGIQKGFFTFSPDILSGGDEGFIVTQRNIQKYPWEKA